jgi:hypothetical protein
LHAKRAPPLYPAFAQRVPQTTGFFPHFSHSQKRYWLSYFFGTFG